MRTETEMMDIIMGIAMSDERIRAVYMNGSRTNPNAVKDIYQDYDIVYAVTEIKPFIDNKNWIKAFGKPLIVQEPNWNDIYLELNEEKPNPDLQYAWLMLFDDGTRIDLGIEVKKEAIKNFTEDKLTVLLLDKDGCFPKISSPTDSDYHIKAPVENEYKACCNEFWWCLNNVAKGIARDELCYAMWMYNVVVRDMLVKMIEWHIGANNNFSVSAGKLGKYFKKYLSAELYRKYTLTYSNSNYDNFWQAIAASCDLFHTIAVSLAQHMGFTYNLDEEIGMRKYINMVKHESMV